MQLSPVMYTWISDRGNLTLNNEKGNYTLKLQPTNGVSVVIPKENVECDNDNIDFNTMISKISELGKNFFFRARKEGNSYKVIFYPLVSRDDFEEMPAKPQEKGTISFKFNTMQKKKIVEFSNDAPDYRSVGSGLNLEGKCKNAACKAHDKYVVIIKGFPEKKDEPWRMGEESNKNLCPACDGKISYENIVNVGFTNCRWKYIGAITEEDKDIDRPFVDAVSGQYLTFESGDTTKWDFLNITVERLNKKSMCILV